MVGAHCLNHNKYSIGVCYEGGLDARGQPADTRTLEQKASMRKLLERLHQRYPKAVIVGHRELPHVAKDCPCFNSSSEYADLQP
jgi:N-acetyl-anhydromuramyl-L-alanine amidase AmpD